MEEIKVGEYIRDKDGIIIKVQGKMGNEYIIKPFKGKMYILTEKQLVKDIVKHSFNIIDLIEVGDYVNGCRVIKIVTSEIKEHCSYIKCINDNVFKESEIKSIVTKEQFKSVEYNLEGK